MLAQIKQLRITISARSLNWGEGNLENLIDVIKEVNANNFYKIMKVN